MMRKREGKNTALRIVIGILIFIILLAAAGAGVYFLHLKPNIIEPVQEVLKNPDPEASLSMSILLEELENVLQEEDVKEYINSEDPQKTDALLTMLEEARSARSNSDKTPQPSEPAGDTQNSPATDSAGETADDGKDSAPSDESGKDSSGSGTYDKLKDNVDPKDLSDALSLSGKVDAGYILGLLSGGLTMDEKRELKYYLMGRLSSSEISRGIELFAKYSYLL